MIKKIKELEIYQIIKQLSEYEEECVIDKMMLRPIRVLGVIGSLLVLTSNYIILMLIISLGMSKGMVIGVGLVFLYVIYLILKLVWKAELNVYSILHKQKTYNKTDKS